MRIQAKDHFHPFWHWVCKYLSSLLFHLIEFFCPLRKYGLYLSSTMTWQANHEIQTNNNAETVLLSFAQATHILFLASNPSDPWSSSPILSSAFGEDMKLNEVKLDNDHRSSLSLDILALTAKMRLERVLSSSSSYHSQSIHSASAACCSPT